jgi:hypothetical protein
MDTEDTVTFPVVQTINSFSSGASSTTSVVTLPTGISSGDLLLLVVGIFTIAGSITTPAGWTQLATNGTFETTSIFYRQADGTEGSSVTVTHTSAGCVALCYRITGQLAGGTPAVSVVVTNNTGASPQSGSLTPVWGAADTLWLSLYSGSATGFATMAPAGFSNLQIVHAASAGSISGAQLGLNTATETPGAFTPNGATTWTAWTVGIEPGTAGGGYIFNLAFVH